MKTASKITLKLLVVLLLATTAAKAESTKTADEFIKQAHKHDNMYTLGPEADQQKALGFYQSALSAEPDEKQRLHILYRMAQLNGSAYQKSKGEKPNYQKAISLYKQIIDEYPPEEPKVLQAMTAISSHYTTLRQFEEALEWSKKVFENKTTSEVTQKVKDLKQQNEGFVYETSTPEERLAYRERVSQIDSLRKILDATEGSQKAAVDLVAYSASHIHFLRAHGELRALIGNHPGTVIEKRAVERLAENIEKMPELWAPQNLPTDSGESTIQAYTPAPTANLSQKQTGIEIKSSNIKLEPKKEFCSVEPCTIEKPQNHDHTREIRAPPFNYLSECILGAIGLIILGLGVIIKKKKHHFKELEK